MKRTNLFFGILAVAVVGLVAPMASAEDVVIEEGCGRVLSRVGNTIALHLENENKAHVFKGIDERVKFHSNGVEVNVNQLDPGDPVCVSEVKHISVVVVEHHEVEQVVKQAAMAPAPAPKAAPARAPAPAPAPAMLPHTASLKPAAGLLGVLLVGLALGIAVLRRF